MNNDDQATSAAVQNVDRTDDEVRALLAERWDTAQGRPPRRRWPFLAKAALLAVVALSCRSALPGLDDSPTTKLSAYPSHLRSWGTAADHFPVTIPAGATNVAWWDFAGLLQAETHMQLQATLPASIVTRIETDAAERAVDRYDGATTREQVPGGPVLANLTLFSTVTAPPDLAGYQVYVLDQHGTDNHPDWKIIAINRTTHRVVWDAVLG